MQRIGLALAALLLFAVPQHAQSLEGAGVPYAITNVTVINTTGGPSRSGMTVVVDGARISYVGKGHFKVPKQAHVIDGTGKYLIPGLWDMHVHTFFGDWVPGGKEVTLPLFIANGITGIRDMGSEFRSDSRGAARHRLRSAAGSADGGGGADARRAENAIPCLDRDCHAATAGAPSTC